MVFSVVPESSLLLVFAYLTCFELITPIFLSRHEINCRWMPWDIPYLLSTHTPDCLTMSCFWLLLLYSFASLLFPNSSKFNLPTTCLYHASIITSSPDCPISAYLHFMLHYSIKCSSFWPVFPLLCYSSWLICDFLFSKIIGVVRCFCWILAHTSFVRVAVWCFRLLCLAFATA